MCVIIACLVIEAKLATHRVYTTNQHLTQLRICRCMRFAQRYVYSDTTTIDRDII